MYGVGRLVDFTDKSERGKKNHKNDYSVIRPFHMILKLTSYGKHFFFGLLMTAMFFSAKKTHNRQNPENAKGLSEMFNLHSLRAVFFLPIILTHMQKCPHFDS